MRRIIYKSAILANLFVTRDAGSAKCGIAIASHPSVRLSVRDVEVPRGITYTGWRRKNVPNIRKRYAQSY